MAESQLGTPVVVETDAVIMGAGLSAITAAIHLARTGFRVICIEQQREIANSVGCYFNSLIEKLFYQPTLRDRLGLFSTSSLYTVPAWLINLIYTRIRPRNFIRTLAISFAIAVLRAITWAAYQGRALLDRRANRSDPKALPGGEQLHAL